MDEQKKCIYNLDNLSGLSHFDECNELMSVKKITYSMQDKLNLNSWLLQIISIIEILTIEYGSSKVPWHKWLIFINN